MILQVYAGKKKLLDLVQYYKFTTVDGKPLPEAGKKPYFAIPGGAVKDEDTVRKWAKEFGYSIKKKYEDGDADISLS